MRGVPFSISEEEVKYELLKQNYPVIRATRLLKTSRTIDGQDKIKSPTPLLAIHLKNNDMGKSIFNLDRFFYSVLSVEPTIIRCTTMYQLPKVHTLKTSAGWNPPRCLKCVGSHNFMDCPRRRVTKLQVCVNCGQNHTTNSVPGWMMTEKWGVVLILSWWDVSTYPIECNCKLIASFG
jgi:hypothetical protein